MCLHILQEMKFERKLSMQHITGPINCRKDTQLPAPIADGIYKSLSISKRKPKIQVMQPKDGKTG